MPRRLVVAALVCAGLAGAGVALAASGDDRMTLEERTRLQDRIRARTPQLVREGIYVMGSGLPVDRDCVSIKVANPTRPNVEYLEREFGRVCVRRGGYLLACPGIWKPTPPPPGPVAVPDVRGLSPYEAQRRVIAAGLTYTLDCAFPASKAKPSIPDSPERLTRIEAQCPYPGERVRRGAMVALHAAVTLPGGHRFDFGALYPGFTTCEGRRMLVDDR